MTAPNTQTVSQSLTLQCNVTTVRGITSRVDIVWSSRGTELQRMENVLPTMDNSLVYTDSYTISQLSTTDEGRVIQCQVVINADPSVMASDNITLDVTGKYKSTIMLLQYIAKKVMLCSSVLQLHFVVRYVFSFHRVAQHGGCDYWRLPTGTTKHLLQMYK